MAGFVCDICGGQIRMQVNKTGVCQNCGMEYDLSAIRAMAGVNAGQAAAAVPAGATGFYQGNVNQYTPSERTNDTVADSEIDRPALLRYLEDVRLLETMIYKTDQTVFALVDRRVVHNKAKAKMLAAKTTEPSPPVIQKMNVPQKQNYHSGKRLLTIGLMVPVFYVLYYGLLYGVLSLKWTIFGTIALMSVFIIAFFTIIGGIFKMAADKKQFEQDSQMYQAVQNQYRMQKEEYDRRASIYYALFQREYQQINSEKEALLNETKNKSEEYKSELQKAYSANIIPIQFRSIEGVYYLYDYHSTSNQSLSEALMQANLVASKQRLDSMIQMQSEQIIQQAQANAKLDEVIAQNREILETAQATMNNTAVAAKYAQITATNSAVVAELAKDQLAYQRAEFWLK